MSRFRKTATIVLVAFILVIALSAGLTACENKVPVKVTLEYDGGTFAGALRAEVTLNAGDTLDLTQYSPIRKNSVFAGWTDGKNTYSGTYVAGTSDATLTAVWIPKTSGNTLDALKVILAGLQNEGAYSFAFEGNGKDADGNVTGIALKANVSSESKYELAVEFSDGKGEKTVGVYVIDGMFYVWSPEMGGVVLEDFDMNYILALADRVPEVLGNLLGSVNIVGMNIDTILNLLFNMFTSTTETVMDGYTVYGIQINPKGLDGIVSLLNAINLDSILKGAGLNIKTAGLITWFRGILPDMTINLNVSIDDATGKVVDVTSDAKYEGKDYFEFTAERAGFFAEGEVGTIAPEALAGYQQISLGNIDMHVDISVNNEGADLGALINAIAGKQAIPAGTLMLGSNLNYRLTLKTSLDIAGGDKDENYIVLELDEIKSDGTLAPFISAYYKEGFVYLNVDGLIGGVYAGKGVKIGVDLKELISGVKKVVTDAIDGVFFTESRALNGSSKLDKDGVVALSGTDGNYYVSGSVLNFIKVVVGVFGVDGDKVSVTDGTDDGGNFSMLSFEVDSEFLTAFLAAVGTTATVPDFGDVMLNVKLNADGLDSVSIDASLKGGVKAGLLLDSFSIGKAPVFEGYDSIADYIDAKVADESRYTYSVKELVADVLKGVSLNTDVELSLAAGKFNLMDIVSLFGLDTGDTVTPWTLTADSKIAANLSADVSVDAATSKVSASIVLTLKEDFALGADKILPAGKLLAVYLSEDGTGYIDLSGISLFGSQLPAVKANIDLASVIDGLMSQLDTDLVFDVSGLFGTTEKETLSRLNADGSSSPLNLGSEVTAEASGIIITSQSLQLNLTLATVKAILGAFGVELALPEGIDVSLDASLDNVGLDVKASASLPSKGEYDALTLGLAVSVGENGLKAGVDGLAETIKADIAENTAGLADAQSNVIRALLGTVGRLSISAEIEVGTNEEADLGAFVSGFVKKWLPDTDIDVQIESGKIGLLIALNSDRDEYAVVLTEGEGNVLLSARVCGETVVVKVVDFGSFVMRDTGLIAMIKGAVDKAVDSIQNADLNTLFENLLKPSQEEQPSDPGQSETPEEPETPAEPEQPSGSNTGIDVISLLGGVSVNDAVINIDITREMIATILSSLGIEVDFVSANGLIDIADGRAEINADIGDGALELGIGLSIGRTDDESTDYGFAVDLLEAYGDGYVPATENGTEHLRSYLETKLRALGEYRNYMTSWSLSALANEYTRYSTGDGVVVFTSREDLQAYVMGLLSGISLTADVKVDFTPGEYNILDLVGRFVDLTSLGLPEDSSLIVSFGDPSIDLSVRFNSAIVTEGSAVDGVMALEIIANRPLSLGTTVGGGESVTVIPEGEALLAVYVRNGSLYIDVTALEVLGLRLPVFKADNFDLPAFLYGKIDELVSGIFAENNAAGDDGTTTADALALAGGDGGNMTLILARNRLQLSVTMAAIGALLSNFLTGNAATTAEDILSALGDVSVDLSLVRDDSAGSGVYTFTLSAGGNVMNTVDGQPSELSLSVGASSSDIRLGDDTLYESFGAYVDEKIAGYDKTYSDILRGIADNLFKGSMLIDVEVDFNTGKYYLNELVNNILSAVTDGSAIAVPIAVETGSFGKALQLALQWNLDPDTKQLKLMFEVRDGAKVLIGAYMYDGELVVDLTGVGLISVKVSNVAVIAQLTESLTSAIDSLQGLDLNELLGGLFGDSTTMSATPRDGSAGGGTGGTGDAGDAEASDNAWIAQLLGVVMLENTNIKLALSTEILENVIFALAGKRIDLGDLFDLSANLGILSGVVSFDAKLFGNDETALIGMSVDASLSNDTIVSNAYIQAVFMRDHYEIDASNTGTIIADAINNFADVNFALDLSLSFRKGTYNIAELISKFGVSALAGTQLLWEFTEDTTLSLRLEVKLKLYADDGTDGGRNGMASIEIKTKDAFRLGASQLFPADTVLIGLYAYENVLYLDPSGISLLGVQLPVFKVDFDLLGKLMVKLGELGNAAQTQSEPVIVASDETGEGNDTVLMPLDDSDGEISIGITENEIAVTAALGAIAAVLEDLGVNLGVDLGAFDVTAAIRIKDGLSVEVGGVLVPSTDGTEKPFMLALTIPKDALQFGVDVNALGNYLKQKANAYKDYNDDLIATLKETLGNNSIKADVTIESQASKVDMNSLIAGILKTAGVDLNIPVNLYFDEMNYQLELLVNWDINSRKLLMEINILGKINKKTLIGLYGDSNDLYIALGGVGLVDLRVKGSPLVPLLFNKLDEALAGINPIVISDILEDLFAGKDLSEESANVNSGETQPLDGENASTLAGGNDLIRYLLSSLKITDSKAVADITSDIMAQIMRALGIDIDFVFEAGVGVDLAGDKIEGYVNIGSDSQIGLVLGLNGKPTRFLPSDLSTYITIDAENGAQDGGQVVKEFIDGFDFAFSLDLMSATVGTLVDSSRGVTYTRVEIKKVTGVVALDNHSMTAGAAGKSGILLSVLSVSEEEYNSHGSGTTKAMMHVYLDYSAGSATLYLCPGWFEIKVILGIPVDITTYLKSMTLQLDLLNMLAPTVENLIKQVNDAANNLGNEETPEETPPSQDTGSGEETEPTGIAKVIADLDIEALLRPGIDLNLLSTGVTNLNVKFDPYELNKLIDGIMGCLFGADTILDLTTVEAKGAKLFSQNYLQRMWWDRLAGSNTASAAEGKTPYSTWDSIQKDLRNIINDVLPAVGYGNISWLLGVIDWSGTTGNFHEIFKRITSIAVFNEAEINVNLLEGTLANISFIGSDTGAAVTKYELGSDGVWRDTGEILTHRVRSTYAISSKRDTDGAYYYTYKYAGSGPAAEYGGRGLLFRSGYAYYSEKGIDATYGYLDYNKNYSQIYYSNEIWIYNKSSAVGDPNYTLNGTEGAVDWGNLSANVTFNPYMYSSENQYQTAVDEYWDRYFSDYGTAVYQKGTAVKRGTISLSYNGRAFDKSVLKEIMNRAGTHTIRATATFKDGTSSWTDLTFRVKDVGTGGQDSVRSVDTVNLHVYESVPDYFTVTTYSGERVKYYTDGKTVTLEGDYKATSPAGGTKTARLKFANGASYPVTINYYDSTINDQTINISWYDLDFSAGSDAAVKSLLDRFDMYYGDGTFIPELLTENATWDTTELYGLVARDRGDLSAATFKVTVTFDKRIGTDGTTLENVESALRQTVTLTLNMEDKRKLSIVYQGLTEGNYLKVDPYRYYMYMVTGNESDNPIPSTVTATYQGGKKETVNVVTQFAADTDWSYMTAKTVTATVKIDPTKYDGKGYFDENMQISVNIDRNVIQAVYFDDAKTQDYIVRGEKYAVATVVFTNGLELKMPVAIVENGNTADVYIGFDVETYTTYGKIATFSGISGTLLQAFTVEIR